MCMEQSHTHTHRHGRALSLPCTHTHTHTHTHTLTYLQVGYFTQLQGEPSEDEAAGREGGGEEEDVEKAFQPKRGSGRGNKKRK